MRSDPVPNAFPEAPQHLLGGLNVALLAVAGSDAGQLAATRAALEESGVTVVLLSSRDSIANADADAFDGVVLIGGAEGVQGLAREPALPAFLQGLDQEGKPLAAIAEGIRLLPQGDGPPRRVSPPLGPVCLDGNWLTTSSTAPLETFHRELRQMLAQRRLDRVATVAEDTPSAVGEDG